VQVAKEIIRSFNKSSDISMPFLPFLCNCPQLRAELLNLDTRGNETRAAVVEALQLVERVWDCFTNNSGQVHRVVTRWVPHLSSRAERRAARTGLTNDSRLAEHL
jgi:hypothetical protein